MTKNRILMMAMALCVAVAMSAQSAATQSPQDGEQVYEMVDEQPQFPGGAEGLMKWLRGNLRYPPKAKKQGKSGRVLVQFVVNKNGKVTEEKIIKSAHPLLDKETLRLVKKMPNWTPGRQKGKAVRVRFTLPITFKLP